MLNKFLIVNFKRIKNYLLYTYSHFFRSSPELNTGPNFCLSLSGLNFVYTFSFLSLSPCFNPALPLVSKVYSMHSIALSKNGKDNDAVSVAVSTWPLQNHCYPSIPPSFFIIYKNFSKMGSGSRVKIVAHEEKNTSSSEYQNM